MQVFVSRWAHESIPHQTHHSTTCRPAVSPQLQRPLPQLPWESGRPTGLYIRNIYLELSLKLSEEEGMVQEIVVQAVASPCPGNQWETIYICKQPLSWWDWITYQFQYTNHIYMTKLSLIIASKRFSSSPALRASWFKKSIPWARVSQLHSLDVSVAMGDGFLAIYAKCFSPKLRNVPMHATINDFRFKSN